MPEPLSLRSTYWDAANSQLLYRNTDGSYSEVPGGGGGVTIYTGDGNVTSGEQRVVGVYGNDDGTALIIETKPDADSGKKASISWLSEDDSYIRMRVFRGDGPVAELKFDSDEGIIYSQSYDVFGGLKAAADYSSSYGDLSYTQKIYVDNKFADGLTQDIVIAGTGTLSFTSGLLTGFVPE